MSHMVRIRMPHLPRLVWGDPARVIAALRAQVAEAHDAVRLVRSLLRTIEQDQDNPMPMRTPDDGRLRL